MCEPAIIVQVIRDVVFVRINLVTLNIGYIANTVQAKSSTSRIITDIIEEVAKAILPTSRDVAQIKDNLSALVNKSNRHKPDEELLRLKAVSAFLFQLNCLSFSSCVS